MRHGFTTRGEAGARRAKWEPQARQLLARERGVPPGPVVCLVCVCVCVFVRVLYINVYCVYIIYALGAVPVPITRPTNSPHSHPPFLCAALRVAARVVLIGACRPPPPFRVWACTTQSESPRSWGFAAYMRRERAIQREREREREARDAEREFRGESWSSMPAASCYADELPNNGREPWFDEYEVRIPKP